MDCNQSIPHELACVFSNVHTIFSPTANALRHANSILLDKDKEKTDVSFFSLSLSRVLCCVLSILLVDLHLAFIKISGSKGERKYIRLCPHTSYY
nr:hypothetical protein CFP56_73610 [Quercus suber]